MHLRHRIRGTHNGGNQYMRIYTKHDGVRFHKNHAGANNAGLRVTSLQRAPGHTR
jgi:hypothetical protein